VTAFGIASIVASPALAALVKSPALTALVAFLCLAAAMVAALLALNWWHRRGDRRQAHVRRTVTAMLATWRRHPPSPGDILWLSAQGGAGGRTALGACVEALAGLDPAHADRVREALGRSGLADREIAGLRHRDPSRRATACRVVGRLAEAGAVALLVERLQDQAPEVRCEAIRALGDLRAVEAMDAIADTIETMGAWTNLLLTMAIVRMGPAVAPAIGRLLHASRSPAMTKALLQVTSRIGVVADPVMVRVLAGHPEPEVRVEAVRVLGAAVRDPESTAVCLDAMDDPEWPVRALAAWAIGRVGDDRAIARLRRAMGDPAYWVRHHVAEAIAAMGERGAAALREGLSDQNPFVRDMAAQALYMRAAREGALA
jgi:HEAT repeat protein